MSIDTQFDNKSKLSVYCHTPLCQLTHTEIKVWSYLLYQGRYGTAPSYKSAALKLAFDEHTVSRICGKLDGLGLRQDGIGALPEELESWFVFSNRQADHPSAALRYWTTYFKSQTSVLSGNTVSVYSYLRTKFFEDYTPRNGWTAAYIATVLKMERQTVSSAMEALAEQDFLQYTPDPFAALLYDPLTPEQLGMFADKKERSSTSGGTVGMIARPLRPEDEAVTIDPEVESLIQYLRVELVSIFKEDFCEKLYTKLRKIKHKVAPAKYEQYRDYLVRQFPKYIVGTSGVAEVPEQSDRGQGDS